MPSFALHAVLVVALVSAVIAWDTPRFRKHVERHRDMGSLVSVTGMKKEYPYYHTSEELQSEAQRLSKACNGMLKVDIAMDDATNVTIDYVTVKAKGAKPSQRVFILFGEHSRELISPESGLQLLKMLCGEVPTTVDLVSILKNTEFQMVLNGNPKSRAEVEAGDYCVRMNENGVDLNRNWDEKWGDQEVALSDTNSGPNPFSEPETRIFKQLVSAYKPTIFLTVHSGTLGLYMPWAYDMRHLASRNQPEMLEILKDLDQDHCQCPFGAAGKEVGYPCPGTCLDWVYDKLDTPYAFAFEIYARPSDARSLKRRWEAKVKRGGLSLIEKGASLGHQHFRDLFLAHPSSFVQLNGTEQVLSDVDSSTCFMTFNPSTEEEYKEVVDNWANAYLQTAEKVMQLETKPKFNLVANRTDYYTGTATKFDTLGVLG